MPNRYVFPTLAARFWAKVDKTDTCWLWAAAIDAAGYGTFRVSAKNMRMAHRCAYELTVGPIPEGLTLDHLCRVRSCVNPSHLEPVTCGENVRRGMAGAWQRVKVACPSGHPYAGCNLIVNRRGYRFCRVCQHTRNRVLRDARRRAA